MGSIAHLSISAQTTYKTLVLIKQIQYNKKEQCVRDIISAEIRNIPAGTSTEKMFQKTVHYVIRSANADKRSFLSNMSHDIRTPMNVEKFNLITQVEEISMLIRQQTVEHGQRFDTYASNIKHENLEGDALRVRQVFLNILGMAITKNIIVKKRMTSICHWLKMCAAEKYQKMNCRIF